MGAVVMELATLLSWVESAFGFFLSLFAYSLSHVSFEIFPHSYNVRFVVYFFVYFVRSFNHSIGVLRE